MVRTSTRPRLETQLDALETILASATPAALIMRPASG
jgi:hypothetical protein